MKKIQSKMKALQCQQHFSHYKSMGLFFKRSRAANSAVRGRIGPNIEVIRDFMVVLPTCKNEEDLIKKKALESKQDHTYIFQTLKGS